MICSRSLLCAAGLFLVIQGTLAMQKDGGPPKDVATQMTQSTADGSVNGSIDGRSQPADPTPPGHMRHGESLIGRVENRANATTKERHPEDYRDYPMVHSINVPENKDSDKFCVREVLTPGRTHRDGVYTSEVTGGCSEGHGDHVIDEDFTQERARVRPSLAALNAMGCMAMTMLDDMAGAPQITPPKPDATLSQAVDHMANEYINMKGEEQNPERVEHLKRGCEHVCRAVCIIRTPSLKRVTGVVRADGHGSFRRIKVEGFDPLTPRSSAARIIKEQDALNKCNHSHSAEADDSAIPETHAT